MKIKRIDRLGYPSFNGYSKYVQEVVKDKDKYYNEIKPVPRLPNYCGKKVDVTV